MESLSHYSQSLQKGGTRSRNLTFISQPRTQQHYLATLLRTRQARVAGALTFAVTFDSQPATQLELLTAWEAAANMLWSAAKGDSLCKSHADHHKQSKSNLHWRSNFRITSFANISLKITHSSFYGWVKCHRQCYLHFTQQISVYFSLVIWQVPGM